MPGTTPAISDCAGALLYPLSTFDAALLPKDESRQVVFQCAAGGRSLTAARQRLVRIAHNPKRDGVMPVTAHRWVVTAIMRRVPAMLLTIVKRQTLRAYPERT